MAMAGMSPMAIYQVWYLKRHLCRPIGNNHFGYLFYRLDRGDDWNRESSCELYSNTLLFASATGFNLCHHFTDGANAPGIDRSGTALQSTEVFTTGSVHLIFGLLLTKTAFSNTKNYRDLRSWSPSDHTACKIRLLRM